MSREYDLTIGMHTKDCRFDAESLATLKRSFVEMKLARGRARHVEALYRSLPAEMTETGDNGGATNRAPSPFCRATSARATASPSLP